MTRDTHQRLDGRPKRTGAELLESVARVLVHDTPTPNETVRVTVEHPDHDGGTRSWLRYSPETAAASIRRHLEREIDADVVRLELVDDAGIGLSEAALLGLETEAVERAVA